MILFSRSTALMWAASASIACGGGDRTIVDPPPPGSINPTLTVVPHSDDATVAQQLGWSSGVPGAEVTLTPADGNGAAQSFTSTASGTVALPALTTGRKYLLSVRRPLTTQEITGLGTGSDVLGFAGFDTVAVSSNSNALSFTVAASRTGSLVISEWSFTAKFAIGLGTYDDAGYLEVYNNSDTTIYLDGILFGVGFVFIQDAPNYPCAMFEPLRTDPAGIWSLYHQAFPGNGREHPLAPGELAVIAMSAIDHSPYSSGLLDLRSADFELVGGTGADNPSVPNMIDFGVELPAFGQFYSSLGAVTFLAAPGSLVDLPRQQDPRSTRLWRRFPTDRILDAFATASQYDVGVPLCPRMLHENLDRRHGFFIPSGADDYLTSSSRKTFATSGGTIRLQDTRTSAADFKAGVRTPGQLQ